MAAPSSQPIVDDPRWRAIVSRDKAADGSFYYGVRTTGIYCRPSCSARTPKPENVQFHETLEQAEQEGFRPCKRCRPNQPPLSETQARMIARACRFIETAENPPALDVLAANAGLSSWHFQRLFKSITGVTPAGYAAAHQAKRMRSGLGSNLKITEAIAEAGYGSGSRFYEKSAQLLGMTPKQYRRGGQDMDIRFAVGECSLGAILVASSRIGICSILLGDDPDKLIRDLQDNFPQANLVGGDQDFEQLIAKVVGFVEMPQAGLDLPLDIRGTAFQQRVWQALSSIPPGTTISYTELAKKIGTPKAIRAVASACAANNLAVAIPCHRVVRTDGGLSGYRWGVERKRALLQREAKKKDGDSRG